MTTTDHLVRLPIPTKDIRVRLTTIGGRNDRDFWAAARDDNFLVGVEVDLLGQTFYVETPVPLADAAALVDDIMSLLPSLAAGRCGDPGEA